MQADVTPNPGAPPLVDGKVILYMTPEMKKANAHMPYASHWSFGGKDYHHMMTWITSEEGGNGPGGAQLTYVLAMMQALASVPPSVGGSAYLAYNIQIEGLEGKSATDEQWGWSSNTVPGHSGPRPPGDGWESSWNCPYDFFVPRAGRWVLNHFGFSFTNYPDLQSEYSRVVPLLIRDWVLYGNDSARYTLFVDEDGGSKVDLELRGQVLPDVFQLTGLTYKLQIRKEGAGKNGIVYTGEGTIPALTPGNDRKFKITHVWNGLASRTVQMQAALAVKGKPVPGGRYEVEWTVVSCNEGLKAPICLNPKTNEWEVDKEHPLRGGVVTVGSIALSELQVKSPAFIPENETCEFTTTLQALPVGKDSLPTNVKVWVDIYDNEQQSSPPRTPGTGNIARYSHILPAGMMTPCQLRYFWGGGGCETLRETRPVVLSERVQNGHYMIVITASPMATVQSFHNAVARKRVAILSELSISEPQISSHFVDSNAISVDLTAQITEASASTTGNRLFENLEISAEVKRIGYSAFSAPYSSIVSANHTFIAGDTGESLPMKIKFRWTGGANLVLIEPDGNGKSPRNDNAKVPAGYYEVSVSVVPQRSGSTLPMRAHHDVVVVDGDTSRNHAFKTPHPGNHLIMVDPDRAYAATTVSIEHDREYIVKEIESRTGHEVGRETHPVTTHYNCHGLAFASIYGRMDRPDFVDNYESSIFLRLYFEPAQATDLGPGCVVAYLNPVNPQEFSHTAVLIDARDLDEILIDSKWSHYSGHIGTLYQVPWQYLWSDRYHSLQCYRGVPPNVVFFKRKASPGEY